MKKLFSVCIEFEVPVAAESIEEAEKIVEYNFRDIMYDTNQSCCDIFPFELEECPEDYNNCLPYVSGDDVDDKYCQDYFEPKPIEDEESKKHIQKTFLE